MNDKKNVFLIMLATNEATQSIEEVYFKFKKDLLKIRDVLGKEGAVENAAQEICDFVGV